MDVVQTLNLVEKLTKANSPKQTATELLEFVELKQTDLVTKDYFEARMTTTDSKIKEVKNDLTAKITAVKDELNAKITAAKDELNAQITGLKLFVGFNTALLMAVLIKLFVD